VGGALLADDAGAEGANNAAADASRQQAEIAKDQWERYKQLYLPLETEFVEQSKGIDSFANQNKSAQQAAADVAGSFANVREQLNDVPGANPSSQAYLQQQNKINLAEAATSAAAQTGARETVRDKGRAALTDAISLGKNLPANAVSALSSAGSGLSQAGQYAQRRADNAAAGFGKMVGGITGSADFQKWIGGSSSSTPGIDGSAVTPVTADANNPFGVSCI
jgi:hypothetical protein